MHILLHTFISALLISSLLTFVSAVIAWRRSVPGLMSLTFLLLAMGVWSGSYAIEWLSIPLPIKSSLPNITYLGVVAVPNLFLIFALCFSGFEKIASRRFLIALAIEPLITMLLVWTNRYHRLVFASTITRQSSGFTWHEYIHGSWYDVNMGYSYLIILAGIVALGVGFVRANPVVRKQYYLVFVAALIPWIGNIIGERYQARLAFDVTPLTFGFSGLLFTYSVLRNRFMDIISVARGRLIENMSDGVLVLDGNNLVVDINPAMQKLLNIKRSLILGKQASDVLNKWMQQDDPILRGENTRTEFRLSDSPSRYLDLRVTPLFDKHEHVNGRLLVFRDVTDRKQVEKKLRHANERLHSQLIEIGMLQSKLRAQAIRDPLTDLFNRRYLDETLDRELARAAREKYPVCVIMMDLDHFKKVNDTYGHDAGDKVLTTLAEMLVSHNRRGDFACRFGGEEFVVVMPNMPADVAHERAEKLQECLNSMFIQHGKYHIRASVSIGIASYPSNGEDRESLLRAADRAMYAAKKAGRNHILTYDKLEAQHHALGH